MDFAAAAARDFHSPPAAQHVARGELFALVDPQDLDQPLENTDWFAQ